MLETEKPHRVTASQEALWSVGGAAAAGSQLSGASLSAN